jgi:hypothetical protein
MVFVALLKNKMRLTSRHFKFKIPLNCTDGTTLPQNGIYKKQNTGTKLNKSISCAHNILPKNAFNSPNDHENVVHYLFSCGLPLINWIGMLCRKAQGQYRNVPVPVAAYNLKSNVPLQKSLYRNESPLKLYWRIVSHFSYKVSIFSSNIIILLY